MKIACVGPFTYFLNHFPEGWENNDNILCLDVRGWDSSFLATLYNWSPECTLFYRPELYPPSWISAIPGKKIAFLSEPLPVLGPDGDLIMTDETRIRLSVYRNFNSSLYDKVFFYDPGKAQSAESLGMRIDEYRPLPIDSSQFNIDNIGERDIDFFFVGKPTPHRQEVLDFIRYTHFKFVWVAHGISGAELSHYFKRAKVVLNVHADGKPALEPRLSLGISCGSCVLSEPTGSVDHDLDRFMLSRPTPWTSDDLADAIDFFHVMKSDLMKSNIADSRSCLKFIGTAFSSLVS